MARFKSFSYTIQRPQGRITEASDDMGWASEGTVITANGIVEVDANTYHGNGWTLFRFVYDGRMYERQFDRYYTPRGMVTLAARFACDVVAKNFRVY